MFIDSFVAFSFFPIRAISVMGIVLSLCAVLYAGFIIFSKMTGLIKTEGWSSMMLVLLIVSSFQMLGMGVLGEYIWRTLDTVRKRPPFIVETVKDEKTS